MSLFRSDFQVALQSLHKLVQQSATHYEFVAEHCAEGEGAGRCNAIASERKRLAERLAEAIRQTGDLPAEPDPDLETARQLQDELISQLNDVFSDNGAAALISRCQGLEQQLKEMIENEAAVLATGECRPLLDECAASVQRAQKMLGELAAE